MKYRVGKLWFAAEKDSTFLCLPFFLHLQWCVCTVNKYSGMLWLFKNLFVSAAASSREKSKIYKELHLTALNTGAYSSEAHVYEPWERLIPTVILQRSLKTNPTHRTINHYVQQNPNICWFFNYTEHFSISIDTSVCLLIGSPNRIFQKVHFSHPDIIKINS